MKINTWKPFYRHGDLYTGSVEPDREKASCLEMAVGDLVWGGVGRLVRDALDIEVYQATQPPPTP